MEAFKKLIKPYPFNTEAKGEALFGKIRILNKENDKELDIQISLINESQIQYDTLLMMENTETGQDYHMYIYEFFGVCEKNIEYICTLSQEDFYEIEIIDSPNEADGILIEGTIIYSASPIERSGKTIKIKDKASEDINQQIKNKSTFYFGTLNDLLA